MKELAHYLSYEASKRITNPAKGQQQGLEVHAPSPRPVG